MGADEKVDEATKLWVLSHSLPGNMRTVVQMFNLATPEGKVAELITQLKIQHHMNSFEDRNETQALRTKEVEKSKKKPGQFRKPTHFRKNEERDGVKLCNHCKKPGHLWKTCKTRLAACNEKASVNNDKKETAEAHAFSAMDGSVESRSNVWIVDSGATSHMTTSKSQLANYVSYEDDHPIVLGEGRKVQAAGKGDLHFVSKSHVGILKEVLWVPGLKENLFSVCRSIEQGCVVTMELTKASFFKEGKLVLEGIKDKHSRHFYIEIEPVEMEHEQQDEALFGATLTQWHQRFGHCGLDRIKTLEKNKLVNGLKIVEHTQPECVACVEGQLCRKPHPERRSIIANENSIVLHIDTVLMPELSLGGAKYLVLATDEYSGYMLNDTLGIKNEVASSIKQMITRAELESGRVVKGIHTDHGSELSNEGLTGWLRNRGIVQSYSAVYTPQQNGTAERANRTVLDIARTLLIASSMPKSLWGEAVNTAVYINNRLPNKRHQSKTHYELFTGKIPNVSNLRVFGERAYLLIPERYVKGKLAKKSVEAVFVGYTNRSNTYRFYIELPKEKIVEACDAKFISSGSASDSKEMNQMTPSQTVKWTSSFDEETSESITEDDQGSTSIYEETLEHAEQQSEEEDDSSTDSGPVETTEEESNLPSRVLRPRLSRPDYARYVLETEPKSVSEARGRPDWPKWQAAMAEEIEALRKNHTWKLVKRTEGMRLIQNKWVFKIKNGTNGEADRYRARLVAKGYSQVQDLDFSETYAPVAAMTTVRAILAIANRANMSLAQFDVKTAFLNGELSEELHMYQPEGFEKDKISVFRLYRSLFGLKQSPRCWNRKFDEILKIFKMKQSAFDHCLYYSEDRELLLAIYVDDGIVAGTSKRKVDNILSHLSNNFELKILNCHSFLGIQLGFDHMKGQLKIHQEQYILKVLQRFKMSDCNSVSTPELVGNQFENSELLPHENEFKELLGSLLYITTCARPDIAHAVNVASRTANPAEAHWSALKRVLRYLKGTTNLGIVYDRAEGGNLTAYSDADYASDAQSRKSTSGLMILYGNSPIAWKCQRQSIVTLSTTEAEYVAGCELVKLLLPVRAQLIELHVINHDKPTPVYIDNRSAVNIANDERSMARTKHIDIRKKWLAEQSKERRIVVEHIPGQQQLADMLTKPLYKTKFEQNRDRILKWITLTMAVLSVLNLSYATNIRMTDPITLTKSRDVFLKGDTRYRIRNVFANPCEVFFNYSTSVAVSEVLLKSCLELYDRKIYRALSNCKRLPTIGPELSIISATYDCNGSGSASETQRLGRCEISKRRKVSSTSIVEAELDRTQEAWNIHKQTLEGLGNIKLTREKRFIPALAWIANIAAVILVAGDGVKTKKNVMTNEANIEAIANLTNTHSQILRESTVFFEQHRDSIAVLQTWSMDIEERLGNDPLNIRYKVDPTVKGKNANLVISYVQWFEAQHKLLTEINKAAEFNQVPAVINEMMDGAQLGRAVEWSTLFNCTYRLENKTMALDLDFSLPVIDNNVDILDVNAMSVHKIYEDNNSTSVCWTKYTGPQKALANATSKCQTFLPSDKLYKGAVRAVSCVDPDTELVKPTNREEFWSHDGCESPVEQKEDIIQIQDLNGFHKIYCHPFDIQLEKEILQCPMSVFILPGHVNYRIGRVVHEGDFVDFQVDRHVAVTRQKRSPVLPLQSTTASQQPPKSVTSEEPEKPKPRFSDVMTNLTGGMNSTIAKIKQAIHQLPSNVNLTRADLESIFSNPLGLLEKSMEDLLSYIRDLGSNFGLITCVLLVLLIMPALEMLLIAGSLIRIPASLWIGSARRVSGRIRRLPRLSMKGLIYKSPKRSWADVKVKA